METSIFEQKGGTYTLGTGGMYYPDLSKPVHYGKHGRMHMTFLRKKPPFSWLLLLFTAPFFGVGTAALQDQFTRKGTSTH